MSYHSTRITVDQSSGEPVEHRNGKPRPELIEALLATQNDRRARMSYDAARDSTEYRAHWANIDALDADASNSREVRHKLMRRSRHEAGSNGYYDGNMGTHADMVVGVGPTLRMLTSNRNFNQFIERRFFVWSQQVQLRRKLWCMAHARTMDGESFALLLTNPAFSGVQLDLRLMEGEQVQTPFIPLDQKGYIDGIKFDDDGNIEWYDVLPQHPGALNQFSILLRPRRVQPDQMLHWFKMKRPGEHRSVPVMTSTLNLGASARRWREATLAAAETAADLNVVAQTQLTPDSTTDPMAPFSTIPIQKRMLTVMPSGWDAKHFPSEHPNAEFSNFNRSLVSEQARPLSMPYNAAACDSSTYSFASGKLDTLCYRAAIDVERADCNELVLDPMFRAWALEFRLIEGIRDLDMSHQWDWPAHPVIDDVADANATHTRLQDGTISYREAFSLKGKDFEDELAVQAQDAFGEVSDDTVTKMRQITILRTAPTAALPYIAQILGIKPPESEVASSPAEESL